MKCPRCLIELTLRFKRQTKVIMGWGKVEPKPQCLAIVPNGLIITAQPCEDRAKVVMGFGVVRPDAQSLFQADRRLAEHASLDQHRCQAVASAGIAGLILDGTAKARLGIGQLSQRLASHPQVTPGIGQIGIGLEDLPVQHLGLGEVSSLMTLPRQCEDFGDSGHGASDSSRHGLLGQQSLQPGQALLVPQNHSRVSRKCKHTPRHVSCYQTSKYNTIWFRISRSGETRKWPHFFKKGPWLAVLRRHSC